MRPPSLLQVSSFHRPCSTVEKIASSVAFFLQFSIFSNQKKEVIERNLLPETLCSKFVTYGVMEIYETFQRA